MIKKLAIAFVVLLAMGGTVSAFAWWDTLQETQSETLIIGEGNDLVVSVNVGATGDKLIPTGMALASGEVNSITLTYNVNLSKTSAANLTFSVLASNVLINGLAANAGLVVIAIDAPVVLNNGVSGVTVVITLSEPTTEAIYNLVKNQNITFDLIFSATV